MYNKTIKILKKKKQKIVKYVSKYTLQVSFVGCWYFFSYSHNYFCMILYNI